MLVFATLIVILAQAPENSAQSAGAPNPATLSAAELQQISARAESGDAGAQLALAKAYEHVGQGFCLHPRRRKSQIPFDATLVAAYDRSTSFKSR